MAISAAPRRSFADVQRYLRQRRASGQTVSPRETKLAWQAYWDAEGRNALAARSVSADIAARNRALSLSEASHKDRMDLARDAQESAEDAAKIQGITEIGSVAALGGLALKGTRAGSAIGLGPPAAGAVGAAPKLSGGAAAPEIVTAGTEGGIGGVGVQSAPAAAAGTEAGIGGVGAATAAPATGLSSALNVANVGYGAGGGLAGSLIGGEIGKKAGSQDAGDIIGGIGGGAAAGAYAGGPWGALVGGIVGGIGGVVKAAKD